MTVLLNGIDLHPRTVDSALESLELATERLRARGDARAVFPDVYGIITRNVAREIQGRTGFFQEPEWISRLAGRFAERYLETLSWSLLGAPQDCEAWTLAHARTDLGRSLPLQAAALGISAHINFDLALGLWKTIEDFGDTSEYRLARYKHDHDVVNGLLAASLPETVEQLRDRYACPVTPWFFSRDMAPVSRWLALEVLARWRAHVWEDVLGLVGAAGEGERQGVVARMHRRSCWLGHFFSLSGEAWRVGCQLLSPRGAELLGRLGLAV
jgi:hypothetical protein